MHDSYSYTGEAMHEMQGIKMVDIDIPEVKISPARSS